MQCRAIAAIHLLYCPSHDDTALCTMYAEQCKEMKRVYNIIVIQYKSETNLSESHTGWLGYLNHTRTVCTSMQMVTSPSK